jgi:hypothetical protein
VATANACRERLSGGPFAAPAGREALQVTPAPPRAATGRVERPRSHCRGGDCPTRGAVAVVSSAIVWTGSDWPGRPGARALGPPDLAAPENRPEGPPRAFSGINS